MASEVATSTMSAAPSTPPSRPAKKKKSRYTRRADEFRWLNWVYNQWKDKPAGNLDEEVIKQMVTSISWWGRRRDDTSSKRAEELLDRLLEEYHAGNPHFEPTVAIFNAAMDAHAKVAKPHGVQSVMRKMEKLRCSDRQNSIRLSHLEPDVFSMSTLASAWAKSRLPEAHLKAEAILRYMDSKGIEPNTIVFNSILHALSFSNRMDKANRAEEIVQRMKQEAAQGKDCEPDIYSYQSLILAWSRTKTSEGPMKAEDILSFLERQAKKGNKALSPNAHCFTSVIHAWARSREDGRARKAYNILNQMRERYHLNNSKSVKPTVAAYTAVINSCNGPLDDFEKEDAFRIAQLTMDELLQGDYDKANFLSYATFLGVCSSTLPPGMRRDYVVLSTFEKCTKAGQVGKIVVEKLKLAASPALYNELLSDKLDEDGVPLLPKEWTRNVRGERNVEPRKYSNNLSPWNGLQSSNQRLQKLKEYAEEASDKKKKAESHHDSISWTKEELPTRELQFQA